MANVTLIDFTGAGRPDAKWHAADMLIFTKSTRLSMTPGLFDEVKSMSEAEKQEQLNYMARTIPSSWEFADLTFLIEGVTRATAQQITRTRTGSYAMQSQRVNDLRDAEVLNPFDEGSDNFALFDSAVGFVMSAYADLIEDAAAPQDARGLAPLNIKTNIVCKYNLRNFVQLIRARESLRVQGEYSDIADKMKAWTLAVWPWAEPFFQHPMDQAIQILEEAVEEIGLDVGSGVGWDIAKAIDLIRKES